MPRLVDAATDVVTLSPRAAEIFGVAPGPGLTRSAMRDLVHPDDREPARIATDRAIAERTDFDVEFRLACQDSERWVASRGHAAYAEDGSVLGTLGVQDITEQMRTKELLRQRPRRFRSSTASAPCCRPSSIYRSWFRHSPMRRQSLRARSSDRFSTTSSMRPAAPTPCIRSRVPTGGTSSSSRCRLRLRWSARRFPARASSVWTMSHRIRATERALRTSARRGKLQCQLSRDTRLQDDQVSDRRIVLSHPEPECSRARRAHVGRSRTSPDASQRRLIDAEQKERDAASSEPLEMNYATVSTRADAAQCGAGWTASSARKGRCAPQQSADDRTQRKCSRKSSGLLACRESCRTARRA